MHQPRYRRPPCRDYGQALPSELGDLNGALRFDRPCASNVRRVLPAHVKPRAGALSLLCSCCSPNATEKLEALRFAYRWFEPAKLLCRLRFEISARIAVGWQRIHFAVLIEMDRQHTTVSENFESGV